MAGQLRMLNVLILVLFLVEQWFGRRLVFYHEANAVEHSVWWLSSGLCNRMGLPHDFGFAVASLWSGASRRAWWRWRTGYFSLRDFCPDFLCVDAIAVLPQRLAGSAVTTDTVLEPTKN